MPPELAGAFPEFIKYGIGGVIAFIAGWFAYLQTVKLGESFAARVADWKELQDIVGGNSTALANWSSSNEARTRALEAQARATELAAAASVALTEEIRRSNQALCQAVDKMAQEVARNAASNASLREALIQKGIAL
jgi:uncharacterized FAD-dependent dehydrogenase